MTREKICLGHLLPREIRCPDCPLNSSNLLCSSYYPIDITRIIVKPRKKDEHRKGIDRWIDRYGVGSYAEYIERR